MKILFLPYYYYIQYEPFKLVTKGLVDKGVDAKLLYVPNISPKNETETYNPKKFLKDGVPFIPFRLTRFPVKNNIIRPFAQIIQFFLNGIRLKRLIRKLKPDGIIIGSHLGGVYIRFIQTYCNKVGLPIISLWVIEAIPNGNRSIPRWLPFASMIKEIMNWKPYNRYIRDNLFIVTGNILKEHLIKLGIRKDQIIITGNPAHDQICKDLKRKDGTLQELRLDEGGRYIVFLTEVIHEVFGMTYLKNLAGKIRDTFDQLPFDIKIIIKFHPRETAETKNIFNKQLRGRRYQYLTDVDLAHLLRDAELSIGHFSKALETSFIAGTPVLSINFSKSEEYSLYKGVNKFLECYSQKELAEKINSFFTDESFRMKTEEVKNKWLRENVYKLDGKSTHRVIESIMMHVASRKV